jgi:hypothetical protein
MDVDDCGMRAFAAGHAEIAKLADGTAVSNPRIGGRRR